MKLNDFIRSRLFPSSYVIQFSPVRTGSTLIFNILRDIFPDKTIKKAHKYDKHYASLYTVCTVRHPLDCIASLLKIKKTGPTLAAIEAAIHDFDQSGMQDLRRVAAQPNSVIFQYEQFMADMAVVYNGLEKAFGITISKDQRRTLSEKHSIESTLKTTRQLGEFFNWDPLTMLHGDHISETRGASYVFKDFFDDGQIAQLENYYAEFMEFFGYQPSRL
jgi:hypothetical protein